MRTAAIATLALCTIASVTPAGAAFAEPIYLVCTLVNVDGTFANFDVMLNEDSGTASHIIRESGHARRNLPAIFTATEVSYSDEVNRGAKTHYTISRTTLDYTEELFVLDKHRASRRGLCELTKVERAF